MIEDILEYMYKHNEKGSVVGVVFHLLLVVVTVDWWVPKKVVNWVDERVVRMVVKSVVVMVASKVVG